jgi:hypothetical protein
MFLLSSIRLIGSLIALEIFSFFVLFRGVVLGVFTLTGSFMVLIFFVVFVLEGVVGIITLIVLVSFVGHDYFTIGSLLFW